MGVFSSFKDNLKKSEAAVVIQTLLETHRDNYGLDVPPAALAKKLIDSTWNSAPELFNGKKSGTRPHKVSIAAYSLACAAHGANKRGSNQQLEIAFAMSLAKILGNIKAAAEQCHFTDIDVRLLAQAQKALATLADDPKYDFPGA